MKEAGAPGRSGDARACSHGTTRTGPGWSRRRAGLFRIGLVALVLALLLGGLLPEPATTQVPPTPTPTVRTPFIGGFVFEDRNANGVFDSGQDNDNQTPETDDDGERLLGNIEVILERRTGAELRTTRTDENGRYLFENLTAGATYDVRIVVPREPGDPRATTPNPVTNVRPNRNDVNFGIQFEEDDEEEGQSVVGFVFEDTNGNGVQDANERGLSGITVTLERAEGGGSRRSTQSGSQGRFRFDDVEPGTYVVSVRVPSNYVATTATRRTVDVTRSTSAVAEFGLQRAATGTPAAVVATAVARQATQVGATPGPAARATAAAAATAGARGTATARVPTPLPARAAAQRLNGVVPRLTRFLMQSVTYLGGDDRVDAIAEGVLITPDQLSMRILRNEVAEEIVVLGINAWTQSAATGNLWQRADFAAYRREIEYLAPLDALRALRYVEFAEEGGEVIVDGVPTTYYDADVNTIALWEAIREGRDGFPPSGGLVRTTGQGSAQPGSGQPGGGRPPGGQPANGSRPGDTDGPANGTGPTRGGATQPSTLAQPVPREVRIQAWVAREDRIIRTERLTATMLAPISDPSEIPRTVIFDAVFTFWEPERPFTIVPPAVPTPTPTPAPPPPARAPGQTPAGPNGQKTDGTPGPNGRAAPTPPPFPGRIGTPGPGTVVEGEEPEPGATSTPISLPPEGAPSQQEQILAAERALVALVTGGQPRTGCQVRGNTILLDVPFRSQQTGGPYAPTNAGPASLASVLGGYGVDVAVSDLRALLNGLEGTYDPAASPRIETIARVAERAGLNVIDLYRGARFNEWTVEQVRENIRRGYPVVALVQGSVLPGGTPPGAARERYITIVGQENDDLVYHDPAYPDEGTGALRRLNPRVLEQGWLAASIPRLAAAFSLGVEARGLLDAGCIQLGTPGPGPQVGSPTPLPAATVPVVATIPPTPTPAAPEYPFGLPVHPLLLLFWALLILLLLALLLRGLLR